jgi:hypothetical protein
MGNQRGNLTVYRHRVSAPCIGRHESIGRPKSAGEAGDISAAAKGMTFSLRYNTDFRPQLAASANSGYFYFVGSVPNNGDP